MPFIILMVSQLEDWLKLFNLTRDSHYFEIPKKENPQIREIDEEILKYSLNWNTPFNYETYSLDIIGNWVLTHR